MDERRSILNISVSIVSRIVLLAAALYVRRLLIQYLGNDVNGLNSLYADIIGMLAVAELGVGSAIIFSMYSPIVKKETHQVAALYRLYRKLYRIIGTVIFVMGLAVMPFLPMLISDYGELHVNVYITFLLTLVSVVLSYLYSAKTSLIEAHKNNYITTGILTCSRLIRYGLQIAVILLWSSYTAFILCQVIETLVIWALTEIVVRAKYGDIIGLHENVDPEIRHVIWRNVKAMFMHKIGTLLVNTVDSVVISSFIGVVMLGKYANYTLIAGTVSSVIALFFTPLVSVIGQFCATGDKREIERYFNHFYSLNYILGFIFFLGYYAVIDNVVTMCFGGGLVLSRTIGSIIALNCFVQYMRSAALLFRDSTGTFYNDRWKPLAEGVSNLALSLIFVNIFPEDNRVAGVVVATIITNLLICHIVEPYVIFHNVFGHSPRRYCLRNYAYIALFAVCLCVMSCVMQDYESDINGFLVNGCLSVGISFMALGIVAAADREFRMEVKILGNKALEWGRKLLRMR